ncbi:MAG: eukaryotic-like serine/threonine-protein kinase [Thermoanaerobaculia bacterium]|nr:eukaryotic-like serine/threonine-protein kinase [Thermoanaerobaculia bacterium]
MILAAGSRLGHYEIIAPLGAGGMGEVYRARDPRIAREVAVKILPPAFAENADRLRRFEQEARATGAVNHPNLLTVFDVGTHDGLPFIVSELLEGSTLRDRMVRPLAARKAVEYAIQIARGVGAAHDKGIVHRDLKPDNIFITEDERVKLLDFGLAKLLQPNESPEVTMAKTERRDDTAEGAVLGTVAYMSPEQVRGAGIDQRTDIFSFGVVLYEMLTGGRPFHAASQVETMAAIIHDDPPLLPQTVPAAIERIVQHAMEKMPSNRFQSMKDVVFALDTFSGSGESSVIAAKPKSRVSRAAKKSDPDAVRALQFQRLSFRRGFVAAARFAPDGSVIYGAVWEDQQQEVYSAIQGNPESRPAGFPDAGILAVSPTGELALSLGRRFVGGWVTSGTLARAPLFGGAPRELSDSVQDADWTADGNELAVIRHVRGGHAIEWPLVNPIAESQHWISNLRLSPRGDRCAFIAHDLWGDDGGYVVMMDRDGQRLLESKRWSSLGGLAFTPSGDEVWVTAEEGRGGREVRGISLSGKLRTVLPAPARLSLHDIGRDGRVLLGIENARREIIAGTRSGTQERNLSWLDWSFLTGLSSDGSKVLFEEQAGGRRADMNSVYLRKVDGSPAVRLGEGAARAFSPDGHWIALRPRGASYFEIVPVGVGKGYRVPLGDLEESVWWDWTPDGKWFVVWGHEKGCGKRYYLVPVDGSASPRAITPEGAWNMAISPDSTRIVTAIADDRLMIFPIDGSDPQPLPGTEPGDKPVQWSADGGSIFVFKPGRVEVAIDRIDLATATRTRHHHLRPADPAGIMDIMPIMMTRDGESYAYSYRRFMSDLYVVEGLV